MTFDNVWAQLKSEVQERHSAQMRLNTAGATSTPAAEAKLIWWYIRTTWVRWTTRHSGSTASYGGAPTSPVRE
ncbi:hypothetical protein [Streptomyces sp. NPDC056308]|uniref:hypothetical protein n=1 Tax=Streptomyces sp. NPDC056308 TaxID=3345780 RepID=UPI0035D98BD3